jgi:hypothetical protein
MNGGVAADVEAVAVERVFRQAHGQAVATLVRIFGDITLAEDAVQEAFVGQAIGGEAAAYHPTRRAGSLRPHGTVLSMISAARPVVGHSMNNSVPSQPPPTGRARRNGETTDQCGTTNSD